MKTTSSDTKSSIFNHKATLKTVTYRIFCFLTMITTISITITDPVRCSSNTRDVGENPRPGGSILPLYTRGTNHPSPLRSPWMAIRRREK
ncbi:hypothetical protein PoB_003316900 [Plakobranchus ocellatus]|uniref:Uncharacterized protein n=1 Tax=Plakobranchus ocellatus TaxID=259542 RepID=A0AAV4AG72_9GAST|nr:hypothetical protein PoB_003316900 [Plakobranchus ocellatus]